MKNLKTYESFGGITFQEYLNKHKLESSRYDYELSLDDEGLIDLNGIENLHKLKVISVRYNKITSLDPIKNLTNLEELYIGGNKITSLEPIKNLTNLESLYCWGNDITSLKGIENLSKLEILSCYTNLINWVDYIDKQGNKWYIELPKSIVNLVSDEFDTIFDYWEFMEKNQPAAVSRKFNF